MAGLYPPLINFTKADRTLAFPNDGKMENRVTGSPYTEVDAKDGFVYGGASLWQFYDHNSILLSSPTSWAAYFPMFITPEGIEDARGLFRLDMFETDTRSDYQVSLDGRDVFEFFPRLFG